MVDSVQAIMNTNTNALPEIQNEWSSNLDSLNLLPTDDQLDQLVNSLCDNFTSSLQTSSDSQESADNICNENAAIMGEPVHDISAYKSRQNMLDGQCVSEKGNQARAFKKSSHTLEDCDKITKLPYEKRSSLNSSLNAAIIQCNSSLEHLVEKRKGLELLTQQQHNVGIINYNLSYTPRLPDAPTRVDRLMYDINQERCRILGLLSTLEKTVSSFISKTTKDDIRQLLVVYGKAIMGVIKARQSEIASNSSGGVQKLIHLIQKVNRLSRQVDTALWCIEVKEQMNTVKSNQRVPKMAPAAEMKSVTAAPRKQSWQTKKLLADQQHPQHTAQHSQRAASSPKSASSYNGYTASGSQRKSRQYPLYMGMVQHQQTNIYQVVPSSSKQKKSSAIQLLAQEHRAEIFQRYCSSFKNNRNK